MMVAPKIPERENLETLIQRADTIIDDGETLRTEVVTLLDEIRTDRTWRKWILRIFGLVSLLVLAIGVFLVITTLHTTTLLNQVKAIRSVTQADCAVDSNARTLACENHKILTDVDTLVKNLNDQASPAAQKANKDALQAFITQITNGVECNTRQDLADAIAVVTRHQQPVTFSATTHCPTVTGH